MPTIAAERLLRAERRGSSWPIVVEAAGARWLVKLRGAAQGTAPLVAEVIVAELATAIGLPVPARALVTIAPGLPSDDPHEELRDLIGRSIGVNLGFAWLDRAHEITAAEVAAFDQDEASRIVWLDGLVMNMDRSAANPNILVASGRHWLVDHGATLPFHYAWGSVSEASPRNPRPGPPHVLAARATRVAALDAALAARLTREVLHAAAAAVPDDFLIPLGRDPARTREAYVAFLWKRLAAPRPFP